MPHDEADLDAVDIAFFELDYLLLGDNIEVARGALDGLDLDDLRRLKVRIGLADEEHHEPAGHHFRFRFHRSHLLYGMIISCKEPSSRCVLL